MSDGWHERGQSRQDDSQSVTIRVGDPISMQIANATMELEVRSIRDSTPAVMLTRAKSESKGGKGESSKGKPVKRESAKGKSAKGESSGKGESSQGF